jgi:SAM-dependent methyltransferase
VDFAVGDAERLRYTDARFDVVASALGIFLVRDHRRVAAEIARLCRPGGRLGTVAWRPDPELARLHAPFRGAPLAGAPDRAMWGREEYVRELLRRSWELDFAEGELLVTAPSGEAMWKLYTGSDGPARMRVQSMDSLERARYRDAFVEHHERYRVGEEIRLPRRYLVTLGRRRYG